MENRMGVNPRERKASFEFLKRPRLTGEGNGGMTTVITTGPVCKGDVGHVTEGGNAVV